VVLSLDAPSDGTELVARESLRRHPALTVVESTRHDGKAAALNRAVEAATGEVLVFCDARQEVDPDAVRELVADLADPGVGAVTGELVLLDGRDRQAADGVGLYWRYEKALRAMESRIHSTVGATGALYAVRRELYEPLPRRAILDDVIVPMRAVLAGKRTVFEPRARAYDRVCPPEVEFRRKVRTLLRGMAALRAYAPLLWPGRAGVFSLFLWSHKLMRWLVPVFLLLMLVANIALVRQPLYAVIGVAHALFYAVGLLALAGVGARTSAGKFAGYFLNVNAAIAVAWGQFLRGKRQEVWAPTKR
jgi:cellulose synthase/poly-beta-1,6-N-acetylglucosamine synthase-like glycosyltransferase